MLTDYGKFHVASTDYTALRPDSVDAALQVWRDALARRTPLRVRGSGHGLSGASLPRAGEALLLTRGLDHYRVEAPGLLSVGSGAIVWDIRDFVAERGWRLPIYNGGWAGPSLGGFVSAGGLGLRVPPGERERLVAAAATAGIAVPDGSSLSEQYGGLWAHVAQLKLLDGNGEIRDIHSDHADFPWLFASMGQFGLILEVTLRLLPQPDATDQLPAGSCGRIPVSNPLNLNETDALPPPQGMDWLYWFTALVPAVDETAAWQLIGQWSAAHRDTLRPTGGWVGPMQDGKAIGFRYLVRRFAPTPPLLYPCDEDFVTMGIMAVCPGIGTDAAEAGLLQAERDFVARVTDHGWSLYCQAENLTRSLDFRRYLGQRRWARFSTMKHCFDPHHLLNRGEVAPADCPVPLTARRLRRLLAAMRRVMGLPPSSTD